MRHDYRQVDHLCRAGNLPAAVGRARHHPWPRPYFWIFDRHHRMHAHRGGPDRAARHLHISSATESHPLQPVRIHDRVPVGARVLCFSEHPDLGAGRPRARAWRHRACHRSHICQGIRTRSRHRFGARCGSPDAIFGDRHRVRRAGPTRARQGRAGAAGGEYRRRIRGDVRPWLHPHASVRTLCRAEIDADRFVCLPVS